MFGIPNIGGEFRWWCQGVGFCALEQRVVCAAEFARWWTACESITALGLIGTVSLGMREPTSGANFFKHPRLRSRQGRALTGIAEVSTRKLLYPVDVSTKRSYPLSPVGIVETPSPTNTGETNDNEFHRILSSFDRTPGQIWARLGGPAAQDHRLRRWYGHSNRPIH